MVHIAPGAAYVFEAGAGGLELIGGPSPPDTSLYDGAEADGEDSAEAGAIRTFHRDNPDVMLPMIASRRPAGGVARQPVLAART